MMIIRANRVNKKSTSKGLFWCWHCDSSILGEGERCKKCGKRQKTIKYKKSDNPPDLIL